MSKKELYGKVSEDFIELISDMTLTDPRGKIIKFKDKHGRILIDPLLYTLGFEYNFHTNKAKYELLTKDVKYHRDYNSETVYVRNQKIPHYVRDMKVYYGKIRATYKGDMLGQYATQEIVTSSDLSRGKWENILDVGSDIIYRSSAYVPREHQSLEDKWDSVEEEV